MASSGCRKTAWVLGIGCLGIPILLSLIVATVLLMARARHDKEGPANPQPASISIPVGSPAPSGAAAGPAAGAGGGSATAPIVPGRDLEAPAAAGPLDLTLDLSEGEFVVEPGPTGSNLTAEGDFDPRHYELKQEVEERPDGSRRVRIGFRRRGFLFLFFNNDSSPRITLRIPEQVPTSLTLRASKGQTRIELGGLDLRKLNADFSMGDHRLTFDRPVVGVVESADIRSSMGQVHVENLGNARPKSLRLSGSMGDFRVDLDGDWPPRHAAVARVKFSMGDLRVYLPKSLRLAKGSSTRMGIGDVKTSGLKDEDEPEDPEAPTIELNVSASLGDVSIIRR